MSKAVKPVKGDITVITKKNWKRISQEVEDSVLRVWRKSKLIVPKMFLEFRVYFQEVYASTTGRIWAFTPFWRGRIFTDAILMHEFLHWAIYPVDLWNGIAHIFKARRMLAEELKFQPDIKDTDLYGRVEDWKGFEYTIKEFAFIQNVLGDYLINLHIHDNHPVLWGDLWKFLYHDGTFYEKQKQLKRDSTFILYLSVYPELLSDVKENVKLTDKKTEEDRDKIADIITEVRRGRMSKVYALKELVKIFHPYLVQDAKDAEAQGKGQSGQGDPKCPQCGEKEFEVVGYEDPKTGKWVDV